MPFLIRFFGAFYDAALYQRVRAQEAGFGLRYSLLLFGFIVVIVTGYCIQYPPASTDRLATLLRDTPLTGFGIILLTALMLRGLMLVCLAVAARLTALKMKLAMDYAGAFRFAGVAYTPVAVMDAIAFCYGGQALNPLLLFACGTAMLLAALHATR